MDTQIVVNGKIWLVPQAALPALISWLQMNAIDASRPSSIHEIQEKQGNKQLLVERK